MRRELVRVIIAVAMCGAATGCRQSTDDRARDEAERAREQALVRATPTVERVTIPEDSGRLLDDAPPDLSAASPGRLGVAINGVDSSLHTRDSGQAASQQSSPAT